MSSNRLSADRARLFAALAGSARTWFPLTSTQQGIWLAEQLGPGTSGYHDTAVLRVEGALDADVLRLAFDDLVAGNEALRARVRGGDEPAQCFDVHDVDWVAVDLTRVPAASRQSRVDRLLAAAADAPFDLAGGPLWRVRLVRVASEDHLLVVVMHHLIADGWSHGVLLRFLLACYTARLSGTEPPRAVPGYAAWLVERVRAERAVAAAGAAAPVAGRLGPVPYRLRLPGLDPGVVDRAAAESVVPVAAERWPAFDAACRRAGTTRYMALTGLFGLALCRAGAPGPVLAATPLAGRYDAAAAGLLGCLISVVPVRIDVSARDTPRLAVAAGTRALGTALGRAEVPYREVARAAGAPLSDDDPLTNVGVEEFNAPTGTVRAGPVRITPMPRSRVRLRHDLTLSVPSVPGDPVTLLYPRARWSADAVAALAADLAGLVAGHATGPSDVTDR